MNLPPPCAPTEINLDLNRPCIGTYPDREACGCVFVHASAKVSAKRIYPILAIFRLSYDSQIDAMSSISLFSMVNVDARITTSTKLNTSINATTRWIHARASSTSCSRSKAMSTASVRAEGSSPRTLRTKRCYFYDEMYIAFALAGLSVSSKIEPIGVR